MTKQLHIVTLDVPYPANYGGAIDAFYLIKNLHAIGMEITLHCFTYNDRIPQAELNKYCKTIYYYTRGKFINYLFSETPFIIASRENKQLLKNLLQDDAPIIFEALHTSGFVNHPALATRKKIVRTLNIEYDYYTQLSNHETTFWKKKYYQVEAKRLLHYEQSKLHSLKIASIAKHDYLYFQNYYPPNLCNLVYAFHPFDNVQIKAGKGEYCLYHGNLSIAENDISALWLVNKIFATLQIPFLIAGNNPSDELMHSVKKYAHICIIANPLKPQMDELIQDAQVHVLASFQNTGLKLKLLHALFTGRHCIVNEDMVYGTNLADICIIAKNEADWQIKITNFFTTPFTNADIDKRKIVLQTEFDNVNNAKRLMELL